jgi:hypothetical protein
LSCDSAASFAGDSWPILEPRRWRPIKSGVSDEAARQKASKKLAEPRCKGRYLYRAMTEELRECRERGDGGRAPQMRQEVLAEHLLIAVQPGSTTPSPFLHFSWKFEEARQWWCKGRSLRGEQRNLLCRVDIEGLSQAPNLEHQLENLSYVDLSSQKAAQQYIAPYVSVSQVQDRLSALSHAHAVLVVLVAWRGQIPMALFQVIDCDTGEFVRMLDASVPWSNTQARL